MEPIRTVNLDSNNYGLGPLPWTRARALLEAGPLGPTMLFILSTVGSDGVPHSAGIGPVWLDGAMYFSSGPGTRKSRNLAANPHCTVSAKLDGLDLVLNGEATRVTAPTTLQQVATGYRTGGWPVEVADDAFTAAYSAPSAGPAPWHLYRVLIHSAVGVGTAEPHGATKWIFR